MSDSMTYSDIRNFMVEEQQKAPQAERKFKALKFFVGALCLILLVEVVLYTVVIPSKAPVKISFTVFPRGNVPYFECQYQSNLE